ncbi:MAG: DUF4157 domain-containing protein, partial [Bacteroidota bacterium]
MRIHTGSSAVQMSEEINARAFTHGNDIYFNKGEYNTDTSRGKHLLAHELTHTLQQKTGKVSHSAIARVPNKEIKEKDEREMPIKAIAKKPNLFIVPANATIEEIAKRLYKDPSDLGGITIEPAEEGDHLEGIPSKAVRVSVDSLKEGPRSLHFWALSKLEVPFQVPESEPDVFIVPIGASYQE